MGNKISQKCHLQESSSCWLKLGDLLVSEVSPLISRWKLISPQPQWWQQGDRGCEQMVVNDLVTAAWKVTQLDLVNWSFGILPCCEQKFTYAASLWWLRYRSILCNFILDRSLNVVNSHDSAKEQWHIYRCYLTTSTHLCSLWQK